MKKILFIVLLCMLVLTGCSDKNITNSTNETKIERTSINSNTNADMNANTSSTEIKPATQEEIASFSTKIYTKDDANRQNNLQLTCSKLKDVVIKNGETFSFNDIVGKATTAGGYKEADIFVNGTKKKGMGGGNCQISSTLYNAVLGLPGLEVLERHSHSGKVYYVEKGFDAAVSYGTYDFKFKNNLGYTIKISMETTGENVIAKIFKIT